jgi:hypothetical protein
MSLDNNYNIIGLVIRKAPLAALLITVILLLVFTASFPSNNKNNVLSGLTPSSVCTR